MAAFTPERRVREYRAMIPPSGDRRRFGVVRGSPNRDPITGAPGAHPVGTGLGAAAGGMAAGAATGSVAGPVGAAAAAGGGAGGGGPAGRGMGGQLDPTLEAPGSR